MSSNRVVRLVFLSCLPQTTFWIISFHFRMKGPYNVCWKQGGDSRLDTSSSFFVFIAHFFEFLDVQWLLGATWSDLTWYLTQLWDYLDATLSSLNSSISPLAENLTRSCWNKSSLYKFDVIVPSEFSVTSVYWYSITVIHGNIFHLLQDDSRRSRTSWSPPNFRQNTPYLFASRFVSALQSPKHFYSLVIEVLQLTKLISPCFENFVMSIRDTTNRDITTI